MSSWLSSFQFWAIAGRPVHRVGFRFFEIRVVAESACQDPFRAAAAGKHSGRPALASPGWRPYRRRSDAAVPVLAAEVKGPPSPRERTDACVPGTGNLHGVAELPRCRVRGGPHVDPVNQAVPRVRNPGRGEPRRIVGVRRPADHVFENAASLSVASPPFVEAGDWMRRGASAASDVCT